MKDEDEDAYMKRPDEGEAKLIPAMPYNEAANGGRWWEGEEK